MANSTVQYALESKIAGAQTYVTSGDKECIEDHDTPTVFSENMPATGYATADSSGECSVKDSHIHLYFWSDPGHTDRIADIKLHEGNGTDTWHVDNESIAAGYQVTHVQMGNNQYQIVLSK